MPREHSRAWWPSGTLYLFFGYGFPYKIATPKKRGALIVIWLLGLHFSGFRMLAGFRFKRVGEPLLGVEGTHHGVRDLPLKGPEAREFKVLKLRVSEENLNLSWGLPPFSISP